MSRIGKKPIAIPKGVTVALKDKVLAVKGPKGTLERALPPQAAVEVDKEEIRVTRLGEMREHGAYQGLVRALIANMITGVTVGFKKEMSIVGVGYKVAMEGRKLVFTLGYSHRVEFPLVPGIEAEVGDRGIAFTIKGLDRELVGQTCATIRGFKPPEPYKGKGIRYATETVRQKAGKAAAK